MIIILHLLLTPDKPDHIFNNYLDLLVTNNFRLN